MKKTLTLFALVLVIAMSIIAGTLAVYTTKLSNFAVGSVVAKEFILTENGSDTFVTNVKIAPTEKVGWTFGVKNYNDAITTETGMSLSFKIVLANTSGKGAITPLTVSVKDSQGSSVNLSNDGSGGYTFTDSFPFTEHDGNKQAKTFTVTVEWPSADTEAENARDSALIGPGFGTDIAVSVTGTQITS